jgi:cephalosporin-C deacetylase-like acetyl esterase
MKIRVRALVAGAALAVACVAATGGAAAAPSPSAVPPFSERVHLFDYTPEPLTITEVGVQHRLFADVHDITYAAPGGTPASAYLVVPTRARPPYAAVLFGHWLGPGSSRAEFLSEALGLARKGVVSLLPQGDFPWFVDPVGNEQDTANITAEVIKLRRGLDLLTARSDVDPSRIAFVGHDYGAMAGSIVSAVDSRVSAEILMAPDATYFNWFNKYWIGYEGAQADAYSALLAPYDPIEYVGHAPAGGVLFQFSAHDQYVTPAVRDALLAAASEPKSAQIFSNAGHHLNNAARRARDAWLASKLGLPS